MPKLENYFHYRVIDISTIKELALRWRPDIKTYAKRNHHLAMEDIEDSLEELKYYVGAFIVKNKTEVTKANDINPKNTDDTGEQSSLSLPTSTSIPWAMTPEWADDLIKLNLPDRARDSHKHQFGHVVVVGGSRNMAGAIVMAGTAALRAGCGLVSVVTDDLNTYWFNHEQPELMAYGFSKDQQKIADLLSKAAVVIIGPGLGLDDHAKEMFTFCLQALDKVLENKESAIKSVIIDADGLRLLAQLAADQSSQKLIKTIQAKLQEKLVLTPHMGEAKALLANNFNHDRIATAQKLVADYTATVILKGAGSLIAKANSMAICQLGNPGMATAGMGDVLAGLIAGLIAQGLNAFDASCLAVYLHAKAGDLQAEKYGERGILATDLLLEFRKLLNFV